MANQVDHEVRTPSTTFAGILLLIQPAMCRLRACPANEDKKMPYQGLGGLIVLIADVWAIVNIFQSSADTGKKVLWTVLVIVLPVLGFILWYFLGPKTGRA
jgi:Phospholipase_D-nuclease N-terminal